jgi:small subunit ribosomal protein S27Ae
MGKIEQYEISDGKLKRKRDFCPECGSGVFLAEHNNRSSCGKCGYTKMKE